MGMNMSRSERQRYLQDVHVGVIAIERHDNAPLSAPIWYDYSPDKGLWLLTGKESKKGEALESAGRFTLVAQNEAAPLYKYVSVSGAIVESRVANKDELVSMAHRYLDEATATAYLASSGEESHYYLMKPDQWLTLDYSKL